jgi:hypothetical protein
MASVILHHSGHRDEAATTLADALAINPVRRA